ncbi:MAG: 4-hydroxy-tetrahydrodipicolinate synthase [Vulcanimicrobiota bacterium]
MKHLGDVLTAMVTPFNDDLSVNYQSAARLAEKLIEEGSDGIVVAGTTGESPTLTTEEKLSLLRKVKETVGTRGKVVAGTGSNNTKGTIDLSKAAEDAGADGLLVVAPYYNKPPQEGLYEHFGQIAQAVKIPVLLYNIPGRTGININPETVERLYRDFPNIAGMKDSTGNMDQVTEVALRTCAVAGVGDKVTVTAGSAAAPAGQCAGRQFRLYSGDDSLTLPILACGGTGVISVTSHIAGPQMKKMVISFFEGRVEEAKKIQWELFYLFKTLFITSNPIMVKEALNIKGFNVGGLRPPLVKATQEQKEKLIRIMTEMKLL